MNQLLERLEEVHWRNVAIGNQYLVMNVLNRPRVIQVQNTERIPPVGMMEGEWGFIHGGGGNSFAVYQTPPRFHPDNRFYQVPEDDLLLALQAAAQQEGQALFQRQMEEIFEVVRGVQYPTIRTKNAPHIGEIPVDPAELDPITHEPFEDGCQCVRLMKDNRFLFKQKPLQHFFDTSGRSVNPLTNQPIHLEDVERCTVRC